LPISPKQIDYPPSASIDQPIDSSSPNEPSFARLISTSVSIRLFIDTSVQFFNPFLPIIAAGMRVDPLTLGRLVALRSLVGLIAPFVGSLADRYGFRLVMQISLIIAGIGTALTGVSSNVLVAALGMAIWGIGLAGFAPMLQAYISSRLDYATRARGIGILEYSWALAGIIGLFAIGHLIQFVDGLGYDGWRAPFFVFAISMFVSAVTIGRFPPEQTPSTDQTSMPLQTDLLHLAAPAPITSRWQSTTKFFDLGSNARSAYATIIGTTCLYFAAMQLLITHGLWLQTEYGLQAIQLGSIAFILGFADLTGSGLVSLITDRIGKKRSVLIGMGGALIGFLLIPFLNKSLVSAMIGIILCRGCFEFAIVSSIPLLSEQSPTQRGKVMTMGAAINLLSSTLASISGPWLYIHYGVWGFSIISAIFIGIAIYIILYNVIEA